MFEWAARGGSIDVVKVESHPYNSRISALRARLESLEGELGGLLDGLDRDGRLAELTADYNGTFRELEALLDKGMNSAIIAMAVLATNEKREKLLKALAHRWSSVNAALLEQDDDDL